LFRAFFLGYKAYIALTLCFILNLQRVTGQAEESVDEVYQRGIKLESEKETNKSRTDKVYNAGLSASYAIFDWFSVSGLSNFAWKRTSGTNENSLLSFDDFIGGITLSVNHSF